MTVALLAGMVAASAAGSADEIVKARQRLMKTIAENAKLIAMMFDGRLPYDRVKLVAAADTMSRLSGDTMPTSFPTESLGPPSTAKTDIESGREEFDALARHLSEVALALSKAASGGPDRLTEEMRMAAGEASGNTLLGARKREPTDLSSVPAEHLFHLMLQDCTTCHARFRASRD